MSYSHSRLEVSGKKPLDSEIGVAEIAINMEDALLYTKKTDGTIISVGGSGSGGGLITQNQNILTEDFTLDAGFSGVVTSGFTIADGVTFTIPSGSTLSVV